jgi:hypothetical protein
MFERCSRFELVDGRCSIGGMGRGCVVFGSGVYVSRVSGFICVGLRCVVRKCIPVYVFELVGGY